MDNNEFNKDEFNKDEFNKDEFNRNEFTDNNNDNDESQNSAWEYHEPEQENITVESTARESWENRNVQPAMDEKAVPEKKEKKKRGFFFRAVRTAICAVLVGVIAGASFYGAAYAGYVYFPISNSSSNGGSTGNSDSAAQKVSAVTSITKENSNITATVLDVSDIVANVISSVVAINGTTQVSYSYGIFGSSQTYEASTSGSGIIIGTNDTELLVVTNAHVVEDVNNLQVSFCDGTSASAVIKGLKSESDLAVVAVSLENLSDDTLSAISIATLGASEEIEVGEAAIAIGNAAGYGISVTTGIVSAVDRTLTVEDVEYTNLIQTDAAINPGNSGGALFNANGEVIGINSVKMSTTSVEGMGYAISIESVRDIIDELSTQVTRSTVYDDDERGYLGITGATVTSDISRTYGLPSGAYVRSIVEDSAADLGGLMLNDIIVSFDNKTISSWNDLVSMMNYYQIGETVEVSYYRMIDGNYVEQTVEVTLTAKPETAQ